MNRMVLVIVKICKRINFKKNNPNIPQVRKMIKNHKKSSKFKPKKNNKSKKINKQKEKTMRKEKSQKI